MTGATGGLGRAFALLLAARGLDLVVVARRNGPLEELAATLRDGYGVDAEVLAADLTDGGERAAVEKRLAGASDPVDLLVNAAGVGAEGAFAALPVERQLHLLDLDAAAVAALTGAVLPRLVEEGRGGVINVSSVVGFQPGPLAATYAAAKAFVTPFSAAVHEEVRGRGVRVLAVCPGYVPTGFQAVAGAEREGMPAFLTGDPEEVASAALDAFTRGRAVVVPGTAYGLLAAAGRLAPPAVSRHVAEVARRRLRARRDTGPVSG